MTTNNYYIEDEKSDGDSFFYGPLQVKANRLYPFVLDLPSKYVTDPRKDDNKQLLYWRQK